MKKKLYNFFVFAVCVGFTWGCSKEELATDADFLGLDASGTLVQTANITPAQLTGRWEMFTMTSNDSVDFDKNGAFTYDLLEETNCFDAMYFEFDSVSNVFTQQSRLYFDAASGKFSCATTGDYAANYGINGNELTVTFKIGEQEFTETKTISLYSDGSGNEFLKVTLTKAETNAAVYVADDPGNTVASEITLIETVYKKQ